MKLIRLDNKRTKELEEITTPVINLFSYRPIETGDKFLAITSFIYNHNIPLSDTVYSRVDKISEIIGFTQNYYRNYEYRNAVWGLSWKGYEFLLFYSNQGFSVQTVRDIPVIEFIDELYDLLVIEKD